MKRSFSCVLATLLIPALPASAADDSAFRIVPNDPKAAVANRASWSAALLASKPVTLPVGTVYIDGTVTTPAKDGCGRVNADGAVSAWPVGNNPGITGCLTRVVQVGKGPCLRLSGVGFTCEDPIEWVGDGESAIVEVEGRTVVPTGRHRFRNQTFANAGCAFHALAGYYNAKGEYTPHENHADNTIVEGCEFYDVGTMFRSDNQQAISWEFVRCAVNLLNPKYADLVVCDLRRGGCVTLEALKILHPRVTLFKVRDYSPNQCRLVCREFYRDRMVVANNYLTLIEYAGDAQNAFPWFLDVSGWVPVHHAPWDATRLYKVPDNLSRKHWKVELQISGEPLKETK